MLRYLDVGSDELGHVEEQVAVYACNAALSSGQQCSVSFATQSALACHQRKAHGRTWPCRQCIVSNQCPWCKRLFSDIPATKAHAQRRQRLGGCPVTRGRQQMMLQLIFPARLNCQICEYVAATFDSLQEHMCGHFGSEFDSNLEAPQVPSE